MPGDLEEVRGGSMADGIPPAQVVPRDAAGEKRPRAWPPGPYEAQRRRRRAAVVVALAVTSTLGIAWLHLRRDAEVRRYMDQAILLLDEHPMQALAYLLAARAEGSESPGLNLLFAKAAKGAPLVTIAAPAEAELRLVGAAFSADGTRVVTANSDSTAQIWNAATGAPVGARLHPDPTRGQPSEIPAEVWSVRTGPGATGDPGPGVCTTAYDQDGRRVVMPGAYGEVAGWDPTTGRPVAAPLALQGVVFDGCAVARGPGGVRYLAMNLADHTVIVWNATGAPATPPLRHPADILQAAFSPDGSRVLTTSMDMRVRTWDATTGRLLGPSFEPSGAGMAVFSPDGAQIAIAGAVAKVFDVASGTAVTAGLGRDIRIVAFSRDGKRIVTVGETTARVWDVATGAALTGPLDHADRISSVKFSPEGKRVLTTLHGGTAVHVWPVAADDPRDPSPTRVTRRGETCEGALLTPSDMGSLDEWRRFAWCTPFVVQAGVLAPNPAPAPRCYPDDCRVTPYLDFR